MKLLAIVGTAALSVILGLSLSVQAQDEPHPQEENRARPDDKPAHEQDKQAHEEDKQEDKHAQQEDKHADKRENQEDRSARQDERHEQRSDRREDKREGRIPDERFRANFGREHTFRIGRPVIVEGAPRFQFGGYWFAIAQPWPAGWGYDDDVYVDDVDDGYFLLSPVHPGVRIAINVVF